MNIGDIYFSLRGTGDQLQIDAKRAGEAAGFTSGVAFGQKFSAAVKVSAGGTIMAGIGLEIGKQALHGLETAISDVANVIPGMIAQGQQFALTVHDLTVKTGASTETASRFAGTLKYLGINTEGLGMSLKTLSQNLVKNEEQLNKLGIATRDANKAPLDTITILDNLRHYLSTTADGYTKLGLAGKELGRSAGNLIEYFNLTDEQAAFLNKMLDNLAVTMGGDAVQAAEGLKREQNLLNLAWQGLSETLATAVIPTLRLFIGGVIEFVAKHGPELRQMFADITNTVLGFASALVGVSGVTPFQMQMDALGGSTGKSTLSFEQWAQQMGLTIPVIAKTTTSTKGATDAIDRQIASVDKKIERSKASDAQDEKVFQRTMTRLAGEYGAQLAALDLAEQQIAIAAQRRDLNEQLNAAQFDLAKAQKGGPGGVNAADVSAALGKIADIQAQQAENERKLAVDTTRARLQAVQSYIEGVAKLEASDATTKAKAGTLKKRQTTLESQLAVATAAKDSVAIADITAKLEAVKTAESRTATAARALGKQSELTILKTQLEAQKAAISSADSAEVAANKKKLADMTAAYDKYLAGQTAAAKEHVSLLEGLYLGDPKTGTGLGGAISKAFGEGKVAGEAFRTFLAESLLPAVTAIADGITKIIPALGGVADWITKNKGTVELALILIGASTGNLAAITAALTLSAASLNEPGTISPIEDILGISHKPKKLGPPAPTMPLKPAPNAVWIPEGPAGPGHWVIPGASPVGGGLTPGTRAAGGRVFGGMPYLVGERRMPELFVPETSGVILPSMPAMSWTGSQTIEVPVYLDGEVITRVVSRNQERQRRI